MTAFDRNTLVFDRATNPLPPNKSTQVKVFFDGQNIQTIDFTGAIKPLVSASPVQSDTIYLKTIELALQKLKESDSPESIHASIIDALLALESFKKSQLSINQDVSAVQATITSLVKQLNTATLQSDQLLVVTSANANAIARLTSDLRNLISNFTASLALKVSKQELKDAISGIKQIGQAVVEAGDVTYGKADELSVRQIGNTFFVDLQLKKRVDGTVHYGGGVSEDAVKDLIARYAPKTVITSIGGTVSVSAMAYGYNIEVAGAPPIITPIAITSFTGGSTNEIGSSVNVSLAWSYNFNPDTSQSLNQGIGSVPLSASTYSVSTPVSANTIFTLSATDSVRGTTSANTSVNFINRRYFGLFGADAVLTSLDIIALSSELSDSRSKSFISYPCSGNRFVFAYPSRLGVAIVRDGNNNIYQDWYDGGSGSTTPYTVSVTNSYGYTENYYCYHSFNQYFGSPTFVFGS